MLLMRIAIVKLSSLGDIVHSMTALQFIKKHRPESEIDWVVEDSFKELLKNNPDISLLGQDHATPGHRAATVAFHVRTMPSSVIADRLANRKIGVGSGDFYARRCVEALGIDPDDGVVRVSMVHYYTEIEVRKLVSALDDLLG